MNETGWPWRCLLYSAYLTKKSIGFKWEGNGSHMEETRKYQVNEWTAQPPHWPITTTRNVKAGRHDRVSTWAGMHSVSRRLVQDSEAQRPLSMPPTGRHHGLRTAPSCSQSLNFFRLLCDEGRQQGSWRRTLALPPSVIEFRWVTLVSHEGQAESSTDKAEGVTYIDGEMTDTNLASRKCLIKW